MKRIAVILAAGLGQRMGGPKALLALGPTVTALDALAHTVGLAGFTPLVVLGAEADRVRAAHPALSTVLNPAWQDGQWSSVRVGLRAALAQNAGQLFVHPVDTPRVALTTFQTLASSQLPCAVPHARRTDGHPVLLDGNAARAVLAHPGPTLEDALLTLKPVRVPIADARVLENFNTPDDYRAVFGFEPLFIQR